MIAYIGFNRDSNLCYNPFDNEYTIYYRSEDVYRFNNNFNDEPGIRFWDVPITVFEYYNDENDEYAIIEVLR